MPGGRCRPKIQVRWRQPASPTPRAIAERPDAVSGWSLAALTAGAAIALWDDEQQRQQGPPSRFR
jgi:hypothetical protein